MSKNNRPTHQDFDPTQGSDIADNNEVLTGMAAQKQQLDTQKGGIFDALRQQEQTERSRAQTGSNLAGMLSGARALAPMLGAVVDNPGLDASNDALLNAFNTMRQAAQDIAEHAMRTLGIEDQPDNAWAKSMLTQIATSGVTEQWKALGHANAGDWLELVDDMIAASTEQHARDYPDVDDKTAYQVSHFAAMSRLASEVRQFSFLYDRHGLLERLSNYLDGAITKAADQVLEGREVSDADRLMTEQGMLKHGSRLFAEIYHDHAERLIQELNRMTPDERKYFMDTRQQATRVESMRKQFETLFTTLTAKSMQGADRAEQRLHNAGFAMK